MRPNAIRASASFLALALWMAFAAIAWGETAAGAPLSSVDDGWRHTTRGWEHISTWQAPSAVSSGSSVMLPAEVPPLLAGTCIVLGVLGGLGLLLIEIDPVEFHAFRVHRRRETVRLKI